MTRFGPPLVTVNQPPIAPQQATKALNNNETFSVPSPPSSTSSTRTTSSMSASLEDLEKRTHRQSPALYNTHLWTGSSSRDHSLIFGRDVIQVPLKVEERNNEYVNLVLSHREFDVMAVHIHQYDEMRPTDLIEEITRLVKEQTERQKTKRNSLGGNNQIGELSDTSAIFQARILELEYEVSRLNTKLAAARALQASLTDENMLLRANLRDMEQQCVDAEKFRLQNELLRDQVVVAIGEKTKMKKLLTTTQHQLYSMGKDLVMWKNHVDAEHHAIQEETQHAMQTLVQTVLDRERVLQDAYVDEKKERQLIAEKYYELSGRIRVFCRVRPMSHKDGATSSAALLRPRPNSLLVERNAKEFTFDAVFGPESSQSDVYAQMEPVVVSFADGFNACILAYGQTGSGKTYTMVGGSEDETRGMIPRALQQVFAIVHARQLTYKDTLCVSMVEIYNDQIIDLLGETVKIKSESEITTRSVTEWGHVQSVLNEGNANRNIASTSMNVESSRSHALVFLHLTSQHRETMELRKSTLCLVDLAGSERISRSQVEGERLKETQHINKSLSALGDVIYALQHKAKHVPYRNSKLTFMLREMLSGQAKTLMMLQLSPEDVDVDETTCSLQFGARVSQIQMGAVKASVESGEIFRLKDEKLVLERKLLQLDTQRKDDVRAWQEELDEARERNRQLEHELARQQNQLDSVQDAMLRLELSKTSGGSVTSSASPPASPQRDPTRPLPPLSPTLSSRSARSTRSVTSTTSAPASVTTTKSAVRSSTSSRPTLSSSSSSRAVLSRESRTTTATQDTSSRRLSLNSSTATRAAASSPSTAVARDRLARTMIDPSNRRATLSGSIPNNSSTTTASRLPSPSTRIPRPRATALSASSSSSSNAALRRTNSLASTTTSSTTMASTPTATSSLRAAALEKRRALSARSLPSTPVGSTSTTSSSVRSTKTTSGSGWK